MTAVDAIMGPHESAPAPLSRPGADTGRLVPMPAQRTTVEDRFWAKVDKAGPVPENRPELGPCWLWAGARYGHGYGSFYVGGEKRNVRVHRFAYELLVGPIPDGLVIDHLCRTKLCVNPGHLEPVTQRENVYRGEGLCVGNARKTHCVHGHPLSGDNLRIMAGGGRACRICIRRQRSEYQRRQRARKREERGQDR